MPGALFSFSFLCIYPDTSLTIQIPRHSRYPCAYWFHTTPLLLLHIDSLLGHLCTPPALLRSHHHQHPPHTALFAAFLLALHFHLDVFVHIAHIAVIAAVFPGACRLQSVQRKYLIMLAQHLWE